MVTNALAYYTFVLITAVKTSYNQGPGRRDATTLSIKTKNGMTLSTSYVGTVIYTFCCLSQCNHIAECRYAECHYAECRYAECHAQCHYADCHFAECHFA